MFIICIAEIHMKGVCILRAYCVFEYQVYLYVGAQHQNIRWIKNEIVSKLFGETMFLLFQLHPPSVEWYQRSISRMALRLQNASTTNAHSVNMSDIALCVHRNATQDVSYI